MDNEGDVVTTEVEITTYDDETDNVHDQNIQIEVAPPKRVHRNTVFCKIEPKDEDDNDIESDVDQIDQNACESCSQTFTKYSDLLQHNCTKTTKKNRSKRTKNATIHSCQFCGKTFKLSAHLKRHIATHTGEKHFGCDKCKKTFVDRSALRRHFRNVHSIDAKVRKYKCDICEKSFVQISHLKTHLLIHSGEKRHECKFCGKSFRHGNYYRIHIRGHTGEKPYHCSVCDKSFNDGSCFRRHLKRRIHKKKL